MENRRKLLNSLLSKIGDKSIGAAIEQMWNEDLLNRKNLEKLYIGKEVEHRVRAGETKVRAIEQLAGELGCSYEKIRAVVYKKRETF
jgi:hypothetical protein